MENASTLTGYEEACDTFSGLMVDARELSLHLAVSPLGWWSWELQESRLGEPRGERL